MADTWDMSFLVDQATQIQEARGNLSRHFGMLQQVLIGKHLVNFIGDDDRLHVMRMMGRLSQRSWNEVVQVTLRTPMSGENKLALQARPGSGPMAWWLMLSESGAENARPIAEVSDGDALASEDEFSAVAAAAAASAGRALDLSVFRAQALTVSPSGAGLSAAKHAELDQKIGETLIDSAAGGVVSRPEPGHYTLMHDKDVAAADIAGKITETAAEVGVSADKLGLSHKTEAMPADADAEAMRDLMRNMRQSLSGRGENKSSGGFMSKMKSLVGIN
ncbi:PAS domain-containing protein [Dongia sp. agr-C8]